MTLWTATEAALATGGALHGDQQWQIGGVSIDTRTLKPGDLFVALRGERMDGHAFIQAAFDKAAGAVMLEKLPDALPAGARILQVSHSMQALEALGQAARARFGGRLLGVTGSVGKTSTRAMLAAALSVFGRVHATEGNFNNHYGVPLTLSRMPQSSDYAVIEMGMNHAGEISALTQQSRPEVAIITAVEAVHLEFFASVEGIARAKAEIFEGLPTLGGIAVLPKDNPYFALLTELATARGAIPLSFGLSPDAEARLQSYQPDGMGGIVEAQMGERLLRYRLPVPGRHMAVNSLAVLLAVSVLGLDPTQAAQALEQCEPPEGRLTERTLQLPNGRTVKVLDDSYNASPASMRAAFALLQQVPCKGRRCAALGDMLELGPTEAQMHAELATAIAQANIDCVWTAGPRMRHLHDNLPKALRGGHADTADALPPMILQQLQEGDVLLIKGSHGSGMYQLFGWMQEGRRAA